jgi:hypothetical protein
MPLPFWLAPLRLEPPPLRALELLRLCGLRFVFALEREALARARVDADDFERDEPPEERDEPLPDPPLAEREDLFAVVFEREPLDELLLLCPLREADLLAAIRDTPPIEKSIPAAGVPICDRNNPYVQAIADGVG